MPTQFVCGHCDNPVPVSEAQFCCYCGVRLIMEEKEAIEYKAIISRTESEVSRRSIETPAHRMSQDTNSEASCKSSVCGAPQQQNKACVAPQACQQKASANQSRDVQDNQANEESDVFPIEEVHSFALRLRERITKAYGNARRAFRMLTDGMDSGAVSRARFIDAVRSSWGFASTPKELVEAAVDEYLSEGTSVSYDAFSNFIVSGPPPLDMCSDDQTAISAILLPMQEGFLRKHNTPHAAFLSIHTSQTGVATIDEIRRHLDRYLRISSLQNVTQDTFRDVVRRTAGITGDLLTYQDFSRMMSYPYVGQQQWRRPSTSPPRMETVAGGRYY